jgi:hypothetical protein
MLFTGRSSKSESMWRVNAYSLVTRWQLCVSHCQLYKIDGIIDWSVMCTIQQPPKSGGPRWHRDSGCQVGVSGTCMWLISSNAQSTFWTVEFVDVFVNWMLELFKCRLYVKYVTYADILCQSVHRSAAGRRKNCKKIFKSTVTNLCSTILLVKYSVWYVGYWVVFFPMRALV